MKITLSQQATAQVIAGALPARGKLPVSAGTFTAGAGITYAASDILVHTSPVEAGIRPVLLQTIDSILLQGIRDSIYPGCQVLAARHGKVFYHKAFGYQGYDQAMPVSTGEIYDLASVTKILATTMALMHLYDRGLVNPDQTLGFYLPEVRGSNKENLRIRDHLSLFRMTLENGQKQTRESGLLHRVLLIPSVLPWGCMSASR